MQLDLSRLSYVFSRVNTLINEDMREEQPRLCLTTRATHDAITVDMDQESIEIQKILLDFAAFVESHAPSFSDYIQTQSLMLSQTVASFKWIKSSYSPLHMNLYFQDLIENEEVTPSEALSAYLLLTYASHISGVMISDINVVALAPTFLDFLLAIQSFEEALTSDLPMIKKKPLIDIVHQNFWFPSSSGMDIALALHQDIYQLIILIKSTPNL